MSLTIISALADLRIQRALRQAILWKLAPTSGQTALYFTDHNNPLVFNGNTYTPIGSFDSSAAQLSSGLREQNLDVSGVFVSDKITHEDLRARKWDNAEITQYLVDWRVPWIGAIRTRVYTLGAVHYTGEIWTGDLNGLSHQLQNQHGNNFTRNCNARLGDARCGVDLDTFTSGKFTAMDVDNGSQDTTEPRRLFRATASLSGVGLADDWFKYGKLIWTTGANATAGVESEVKSYSDAARDIGLYEPTPFDIADTDEFTIFVGCDFLSGTCKTKFSNLVNFRGAKFMPGSDKVLKTP
jgi:uncharacterized phage protein (TIGR02218 family)